MGLINDERVFLFIWNSFLGEVNALSRKTSMFTQPTQVNPLVGCVHPVNPLVEGLGTDQ